MSSKLIWMLIPIAVTVSPSFPQQEIPGVSAPRIIIKLPQNTEPDAVWIRYLVDRRISRGERMRLPNNERQYVIFGVRDLTGKPENVKVVLYSPGCEFKAHDLKPGADSEVEQPFHCDPLPTKTLRGFIPPAEIPSSMLPKRERRFDISGELEAHWICDYFLRTQERSNVTMAGSCLGSPVPLGILGTLDPANGGKFELTLPDFSHDPAFKRAAEWGTNFGMIEMLLQDKLVGVARGVLWPKDATSGRRGLNVLADYPDRIMFTTAR